MIRIGGVVLAAGEGRRFGGPKQLAPFRGEPLLAHVLAAMEAVPALDPLVVVLGARADEVRAAVELRGFAAVIAEGWAEGQAASLRAGVGALAGVDAVLVRLGDQPLVTSQVIAGTLDHDAPDADAVRAAYHGIPGHPVLLKRQVLERIPALCGDVGARVLLGRARVRAWEAGHLCNPTDVDTPEILEALAVASASARRERDADCSYDHD